MKLGVARTGGLAQSCPFSREFCLSGYFGLTCFHLFAHFLVTVLQDIWQGDEGCPEDLLGECLARFAACHCDFSRPGNCFFCFFFFFHLLRITYTEHARRKTVTAGVSDFLFFAIS